MARKIKGAVIEHVGRDGQTYRSLRFVACGKRQFVALGAVSDADAQAALRHTLADVERGVWQPPAAAQASAAPERVPTFHEYAEQWWTLHEGEWRPKTKADYRWRLQSHLIPFFGETPIDQIKGNLIQSYSAEKIREGQKIRAAAESGSPLTQTYTDTQGRACERRLRPLSSRSINMTLTLLGAILESALGDDRLGERMSRNHARGRRVRERKPTRSKLDAAAEITALLEAAAQMDAAAKVDRRHVQRRAMVATLIFAGLRISELCALRWRHVDLASGWLTVGDSKTDAGRRKVKIRGALRDELLSVRARAGSPTPDAYVFPTRTGAKMGADNLRNRVLTPAAERASANLVAADRAPLPERITPHSLRRTFCSLLYALDETPPVVMAEMGHTDPALALRVYAEAMRRGQSEKAELRALVEGAEVAVEGPEVAVGGSQMAVRGSWGSQSESGREPGSPKT